MEIARLAPYPLLQATTEFLMRKSFDAACRMAGFTPNYVLECRAPHALLALAEAGHGVAIIPSSLRVDRYELRHARVMYCSKPIVVPLGMLWDKRRPMPAYAKASCEMVAEHVQQAFPINRQLRRA